jgi:hypothetical protein
MNIWDSVQRGLEKATHEAGRIARIQRLRATTDNLLRQTTVQQSNLITKAMEVFAAGKLTQSELLPICQELTSLQQQLEQAQAELKIIQSQGTQATTTQQPQTTTMHSPLPPTSASPTDLAATVFAPPPPGYQQPFDVTMPAPTPPPPPGAESSALSELETLAMGGSMLAPTSGQQPACSHCGVERVVGNVYCSNCGHPFEGLEVAHLPTVRGSSVAGSSAVNKETMQEEGLPSGVSEQPTIYTPDPPLIEHLETVRGEPPSSPDHQSQPSEQDGGQ